MRSLERLFDEVSLFLHQVVSDMPPKKRQIITNLHDTDTLLRDKKVLIVDDDMRTVFAMSRFLGEHGLVPLKASNGKEALELLDSVRVDLVLMDIMMPEMDGYEAIARIRGQARFRDLPILALTAHAMQDERARCLEAGCSDYLCKPIPREELVEAVHRALTAPD